MRLLFLASLMVLMGTNAFAQQPQAGPPWIDQLRDAIERNTQATAANTAAIESLKQKKAAVFVEAHPDQELARCNPVFGSPPCTKQTLAMQFCAGIAYAQGRPVVAKLGQAPGLGGPVNVPVLMSAVCFD